MLVLGVANPAGEGEAYNGLFFRDTELRALAPTMRGVPVKCEHAGKAVGVVASAFVDEDGRLNTVMHIDETSELGRLAGGCVRDGTAAELSLGYAVDVRQSSEHSSKVHASEKQLLEVSLVRKGARDNCTIDAIEQAGRGLYVRRSSSAGAEQAAGERAEAATPAETMKASPAVVHSGFDYFTA